MGFIYYTIMNNSEQSVYSIFIVTTDKENVDNKQTFLMAKVIWRNIQINLNDLFIIWVIIKVRTDPYIV